MNVNAWHVDLHLATARGKALRELVALRCTEPFPRHQFYSRADEALRARQVTYRDLAAILNNPDESVVRMRVRDIRPPRAPKAAGA